jgi:hypothetical protein
MSEFPTMQVDRSRSQSMEPLGSKPKFWFRDGDRRLLFKAEVRGSGEDWAEVVACHLCRLIGLPHVEYELAAEYNGDQHIRPGVVCENMARKPAVLVLGNQLLFSVDPQYPQSQRFKVRQHTVEAVSDIVAKLAPPPAEWTQNLPPGVQSALDVFAGYVMLDAWIANQDRHHGNWAAIESVNDLRLAPTFDHGASLARNLSDEEREERLTTRDRGQMIAAFAARGRSKFYASSADAGALELRQAFRAFAQKVPAAAGAWRDRLRSVNREQIWTILERVPVGRMSDTCKQFTAELLRINHQRLQE